LSPRPPADIDAASATSTRRRRTSVAALVALVVIALVGALLLLQRPTKPVQAGAPEDCEDLIAMPCPRQVAALEVPLVASDIALTYSSDRVPGRSVGASLDVRPVGLGGWSVTVLHGYDTASGVLVLGTGERRTVPATPMGSNGTFGVASVDAREIYVFDHDGRHLRTLDALTGATIRQFDWVPAGIATITEPGGRKTRIIRNDAGEPTAIVSARGYRTRLGVAGGWLAAVVDGAGRITHITTSVNGLVSVIRDPSGARLTLRYDPNGRLISTSGPDGQTARIERRDRASAFDVTTTTGAGHVVVDTVERIGDTVHREHVDTGVVTKVDVTAGKRSLTRSDGTTVVTDLAPDPRWGWSAPLASHVITTSPGGRISEVTETRTVTSGNAAAAVATAFSDVLTVDGKAWTITFDPGSSSTTLSDPVGRIRRTVFDAEGRVIRVERSGSAPVTYGYGEQGRVESMVVGEGKDARTWRWMFDPDTGAVTSADPASRSLAITTDAEGRALHADLPGDRSLDATRDELGRVTSLVAPDATTTRTTYREDGRVAMALPPGQAGKLQYTTYDYDTDGGLTGIGYGTTGTLALHRDAAGRVDRWDAGAGEWTVTYDGRGLAVSMAGPGASLTRTFDGDALVSEAWSGPVNASVTRTLDGQGRVTSERVGDGSEIAYGYDPAGRLVKAGDLAITYDATTGQRSQEALGALTRSWTYDPLGQVAGVVVRAGDRIVYELHVERDALQRVTSRSEAIGGAAALVRTFAYDDSNRLSSVAEGGAVIERYTYDAAGNLKLVDGPDGKLAARYDGHGQLAQQGDVTFSYDAAGRLASATGPGSTTTYGYDLRGDLLSVQATGKPRIDYVIDATGRRVGKQVAGSIVTSFAFDDAYRPAAALDPSGKVATRLVYGTGRLAPSYETRGGVAYLVVTDELGTPRLAVGPDGTIAAELDVDAWGNILKDTSPDLMPFGFGGGLLDRDTGLIRFGARDYDPALRRWTAPDPLGVAAGDVNRYRFVHDDPINRSDPSGLCDVVTVGLTGSLGGAGIIGSVGVGIVWGDEVGVYGTYGYGVGLSGAGGGLVGGCLADNSEKPGSTLNKFEGSGHTTDVSAGPFDFGYDFGQDSGNGALDGVHWGVVGGTSDVGISVQRTSTGVVCITCHTDEVQDAIDHEDNCGGIDAGLCDSDKNPPTDPANEQNVCSGNGTCSPDNPDDPNAPDAGAGGGGSGNGAGGNGGQGGGNGGQGGGQGGPGGNTPGTGSSTGDPHLLTVDGFRFDFQAAGEFTALTSDRGDLVVQVRQTPWPGGLPLAQNAAVAMSVNGDRIGFYADEPRSVIHVNGRVTEMGAETIELANGGKIVPSSDDGGHTVVWPDGSKVHVLGINVDVTLAAARKGTVHGLLGPYDGTAGDHVEARDGMTFDAAQLMDHDTLYRRFGDSWRIVPEASLFEYRAGESNASFDDRAFPDDAPTPAPAAEQAAATAVCQRAGVAGDALPGCVLDVSQTGDPGFATSLGEELRAHPATVAELTSGVTAPFPSAGPVETPAPGPINGGTIVRGEVIRGSIDTPGEVVEYDLTASAGEVAYFAPQRPDCPPSDMAWEIRDPLAAGQVGIANICGDQARVDFPHDGQYRLLVYGGRTTTGPFQLTWIVLQPDQHAPLVTGQTTGSLDNPGERDWYEVDGHAGETYQFQPAAGCSLQAMAWEFVELLPDGSRRTLDVAVICGALSHVLTEDGRYAIEIYSQFDGTGTYTFTTTRSPG
jgi:RHS repeat-associated protein